jgi:hypothetical protein
VKSFCFLQKVIDLWYRNSFSTLKSARGLNDVSDFGIVKIRHEHSSLFALHKRLTSTFRWSLDMSFVPESVERDIVWKDEDFILIHSFQFNWICHFPSVSPYKCDDLAKSLCILFKINSTILVLDNNLNTFSICCFYLNVENKIFCSKSSFVISTDCMRIKVLFQIISSEQTSSPIS